LNPRRWRAFADAIAVALGLNVWLALVVFPGHFVGAWSGRLSIMVAVVPLMALALGVWRRSEAMLLFGFPTALLLPVAIAPDMVAVHVYGPIHFAVVAVGLVAYLFGASVLTSMEAPPPPAQVRPLTSSLQPTPVRWRRRSRVYLELTALSVVVPLSILYSVNFDESIRVFIREMYPGRAASFTAVVNLGAVGFWLILYGVAFLGPLAAHRTGDRKLEVRHDFIRRSAKRRDLGAAFYGPAAAALILLVILSIVALRGSQ